MWLGFVPSLMPPGLVMNRIAFHRMETTPDGGWSRARLRRLPRRCWNEVRWWRDQRCERSVFGTFAGTPEVRSRRGLETRTSVACSLDIPVVWCTSGRSI